MLEWNYNMTLILLKQMRQCWKISRQHLQQKGGIRFSGSLLLANLCFKFLMGVHSAETEAKRVIEWLNCCLFYLNLLPHLCHEAKSTQFLSSRGINTQDLPRGSGKEFQRLVEWLPAFVSTEETAKSQSSDYRIWDSLKFHKVVCILLYPLIILILLPRIDVGFEVAWNVCNAHIFLTTPVKRSKEVSLKNHRAWHPQNHQTW